MYLDVSHENGRRFLERGITGSVVMLNLLRFRDRADYSGHPELAPVEPVSGSEAYELYIEHTRPFLEAAGGEVLYIGSGGHLLIGPEEARWDLVLLVRHASVKAFLAMATNEDYLAGIGHRTAAVEDSRLLPLIDSEIGRFSTHR